MTAALESTNILLVFIGATGIAPYYDAKTKSFKKSEILTAIVILILAALTGYACYTITTNEELFKPLMPLQICNLLTMFIAVFLSMLKLSTRFGAYYEDIFISFATFDKATGNEKQMSIIGIVGSLIGVTLKSLVVCYLRFSKVEGITNIIPIVVAMLLQCYIGWIFVLALTILQNIRVRFEALNKTVKNFNLRLMTVQTIQSKSSINDYLIEAHNCLCDSAESVSAIFGWYFFVTTLNNFFNLITCLVYLFQQAFTDVEFEMLVFNIMYIFVVHILLTTRCDEIIKKSKLTTSNAFKTYTATKEESFLILAQQAASRSVEFSAAGIYNYTFPSIIKFILTYFMIILGLGIHGAVACIQIALAMLDG